MKKQILYTIKITLSCLVFCVCVPIIIVLTRNSIEHKDPISIDYSEKSNLDYDVYLKENDFYDEDHLGKGMSYVTGLIDYVEVHFKYTFDIDQKTTADFIYQITGNLNIANNGKQYLAKDYTLLNPKTVTLIDGKTLEIDETIKIDYDTYNKFASEYRTDTGINAVSNLDVTMSITKRSAADLDFGNTTNIKIKIPLSERSINIALDYVDLNKTSTVIDNGYTKIVDPNKLIIAAALAMTSLISFIFFVILIIKGSKPKDDYDSKLKRILRDYDRFIVETKTTPNTFAEDKIITVEEFKELLDVRDTANEPIMHVCIVPHQKSKFYITHNDKLFIMTLKAKNYEEREE